MPFIWYLDLAHSTVYYSGHAREDYFPNISVTFVLLQCTAFEIQRKTFSGFFIQLPVYHAGNICILSSFPFITLIVPICSLGAYLHISAMHIFSAIPDTEYDRAAGITTTPVYIGEGASLIMCLIFWLGLSFIVVALAKFYPLSFLVFLYPLFPLILLIEKRDIKIIYFYWYLTIREYSFRGHIICFSLVIYKVFFVG